MKHLLVVFLLGLLSIAGAAHGRGAIPVENFENEAIAAASGKALTLDEVARALRQAAPKRGWRIEDAGPGKALATLEVRGKHTIRVDVAYTEKSISLLYKDSINMKYGTDDAGKPVIHPFYEKWVRNLLKDLRAELGRY